MKFWGWWNQPLNTISGIEISKCQVMWRHSVPTWRHEVAEHILAFRCARKMILLLFLWYFESSSSNMLSISHLYDSVTPWRHVMTSQNLICLSQLVNLLESWFFFVSMVFKSLSSKTLLIFHLCDVMMSCHDVTEIDSPISACRFARVDYFLFT